MPKHFIRTNIPPTASLPELLCRQAQQLSGRNMRSCLGTDFDTAAPWDVVANGAGVGFSTTKPHTLRITTSNAAVNESGVVVPYTTFGLAPAHVINPATDRWMAYARGRMQSVVSNSNTSMQGWGLVDSDPAALSNPKVFIGALGNVSTANFVVAGIASNGTMIAAVDTGIALDLLFHDFHLFNDLDDVVVRGYIDGVQVAELDATNMFTTPAVAGFFVNSGAAVQALREIEADAIYVVTEQASN